MSRVRVLIVEDDKIWQGTIQRSLQRANCVVDTAANYTEAQHRLCDNAYDMVTLDMALSDEEELATVAASSGWAVLVDLLTQDYPGTAIYVISASFGNEPERAFELIGRYGVRDFMNKGKFDPDRLHQWVLKVRKFKGAGGRPNVTPQELLDISSTQPDIDNQELLSIYQQVLKIYRRNKARAERQMASHGGQSNVPDKIANQIDECDREIGRITALIAELQDGENGD